MLHEPELLLLDEPTAGVDPKARRDFWEELHALAARGITVLVSTHYMDEAERCHKLAYIAYGKLLAQGTAEEVIASQALTTWEVTGADLPALAERLRGMPGVEQVAAFGDALHVTGANRDALEAALAPLMNEAGREWREVEPGLEDVFIHLMRDATTRRQRRARRQREVEPVTRLVLVFALAGHRRQGIHAAQARPPHLRHDGRHPDHPARAVRLRHQHRSEAPADRGAGRRPQRVHAQHSRGAEEQRLLRLRRRGAATRTTRTAMLAAARCSSSSAFRPISRAGCCAASARRC